MAISVGVHTKASDATTNTTTTSAVTTAASGSTFVIGIAYPNSDTVTSVTDSKSNTYTLIQQVADVGDGLKVALYYCQNGVGGSGHTASLKISSTDPKAIYFTEILGAATTSVLDQNSGILDTATPFDSPVTTTQANELVYTLLVSSNATASVTWNGGFTGLDSDVSGVLSGSANATRVVAATGTYSPAATTSAGGNAVVMTASFVAAGTTAFTLSVANISYSLALQNTTLTGPNPAALNAAQITYSYALQNQPLGSAMPASAIAYSLSLVNQTLSNTSNYVVIALPIAYAYAVAAQSSDLQFDISPLAYSQALQSATLQIPLPPITSAGGTFDSLTPMPGLML